MRRWLFVAGAAVGSLLSATMILAAIALVNGGFVYRTQCPTLEGNVRTDWSYDIFQVLPYVLPPKETGCEVHSATRVLASRVGIARLDTPSASDFVRNYASEASDPDLVYWAGVQAVLYDLQNSARESRPFREAFTYMREQGSVLRGLSPPAYVAEKHAAMLAVYDEAVRLGFEALDALDVDQARSEELARQSVEATGRFAELADEIRVAIVREQ